MTTALKIPKRRHKMARSKNPAQTPVDNPVRALRQKYKISQALLARLLEVSLRTISGLESGTVATALVRRNLTQITRLCDGIGEAAKADFVGEWLDQPNEMLAGLKPVEVIERGQFDVVWRIVEGLRHGSNL